MGAQIGVNTDANRIAQEPLANNPCRKFIAVKAGRENEPWVRKRVAGYQNDVVEDVLAKIFRGTGLPAW